ncbi:MAG: hypothetical protein ACOY4B_02790 [Pseudomonadota bacterium]
MAGMLALSALPGLLLGWLSHQLGTFIGCTSFLLIPQIVGWQLFVVLKTGIMPQRGAKVSRTDSPMNFWITAAAYGAVMATYVWINLMVLFDLTKPF